MMAGSESSLSRVIEIDRDGKAGTDEALRDEHERLIKFLGSCTYNSASLRRVLPKAASQAVIKGLVAEIPDGLLTRIRKIMSAIGKEKGTQKDL